MDTIEIVLFDMGNTLLDFHQGKSDDEKVRSGLEGLRDYINREYYYSYSTEDLYEKFQKPLENFLDNERKQKGVECNIVDYFANILNEDFLDQQTIHNLCKIYYKDFAKYLVVNDGMEQLIKTLKEKGLCLWLVSNAFLPDTLYKEMLQDLGLFKYFDGFTFSYNHTFLKPHLSIFKAALTKAKKKADRALFIGDNYEVDIKPALALGMNAYHYNKNQRVDEMLSTVENILI